MTCREKLKMEHPECINEKAGGGCLSCPHTYGYLPRPEMCNTAIVSNDYCVRCWDREIPDEEPSYKSSCKRAAEKMHTMYEELVAVGFDHHTAIKYLGKALELAKEGTDDDN